MKLLDEFKKISEIEEAGNHLIMIMNTAGSLYVFWFNDNCKESLIGDSGEYVHGFGCVQSKTYYQLSYEEALSIYKDLK